MAITHYIIDMDASPGDIVICVGEDPTCNCEPFADGELRAIEGRHYTVSKVFPIEEPTARFPYGYEFHELAPNGDWLYCPCSFRKINDGEGNKEALKAILDCWHKVPVSA